MTVYGCCLCVYVKPFLHLGIYVVLKRKVASVFSKLSHLKVKDTILILCFKGGRRDWDKGAKWIRKVKRGERPRYEINISPQNIRMFLH
jgi:hypothetical protein